MSGFRAVILLALAGTAVFALSGCDTMGLGFGPAPSPAAAPARALDYRNDDLASTVFALDVPESLRLMPSGSFATFDAGSGKTGRHLKAVLTLADGDAIDSALPPPAAGSTYYLLGFSEKDKPALREAQKSLKTMPADAAPGAVLQVSPRFCSVGAVDPASTMVTIIPALPGASALLPLVASAPLATLPEAAGTKACAG
jgi:hypothetical protein